MQIKGWEKSVYIYFVTFIFAVSGRKQDHAGHNTTSEGYLDTEGKITFIIC